MPRDFGDGQHGHYMAILPTCAVNLYPQAQIMNDQMASRELSHVYLDVLHGSDFVIKSLLLKPGSVALCVIRKLPFQRPVRDVAVDINIVLKGIQLARRIRGERQ